MEKLPRFLIPANCHATSSSWATFPRQQREANLLTFLYRKSLTATANPEYNSSSISSLYEDTQPAKLQFPHAKYDNILCNNGIWWIGLGQYVTQEH